MQQASETPSSRVRVAVVDDFQMIVDGLISQLSAQGVDLDIDVVISATSWGELTGHPEYPTDVTVLDLNLGDQIRIETKVRALTAAGSRVILISRHSSALGIARALDSGALGFVPKSAPAAELIAAVRAVARGNRYVSELYEPPALDLKADASLSLGTQEHRALVLSPRPLHHVRRRRTRHDRNRESRKPVRAQRNVPQGGNQPRLEDAPASLRPARGLDRE
ncbi:MAG: response regulator transcription factor [Cryobacterium sp.]|nr:response regulator transcription factor [Cryobacterium sp.]